MKIPIRLHTFLLMTGSLLGALLIIALLVGFMLPAQREITRSEEFSRLPNSLWETITTPEEQGSWRSDIERVETHDRIWREYKGENMTEYKTIAENRPSRLVRRALAKDGTTASEREYMIEPLETGSRLTITERRTLTNPLARFFRTVFARDGAAITHYLRDLEERLAQ